jgi:hypothetical protein
MNENILNLNKKIEDIYNELKTIKQKMEVLQNFVMNELYLTHSKYNDLIQYIINNVQNTLSETDNLQNRYIKELKDNIEELKSKFHLSKKNDEKKKYEKKLNESIIKADKFNSIITKFKNEKIEKINEKINGYLKYFKDNINTLIKNEFSLQVNDFLNSFLKSQNNFFMSNNKNQIKKIIILKSNKLSQPINHLNIIIIGEQKNGKAILIKEILKDIKEKKKVEKFEDIFDEYSSKNIPYITLIESLDLKYNLTELVVKTKELINERFKSKKRDSFIHSVIFLFNSNRLFDNTIKSINELNNEIPVIFIYKNIKNIKNVEAIENKLKDKDFNGEFIHLNQNINDENINKIIEISKKGIQESCIKYMIKILRINIECILDLKIKRINIEKEIENCKFDYDINEIYGDSTTQILNNLVSNIINTFNYGIKKDKNYILPLNNDYLKNFLIKCKKQFKDILVKLIKEKLDDLIYELIIIQQKFIKENNEYKKYISKVDELVIECKRGFSYNFLPSLIKMSVINFFKYFLIEFIYTLKVIIKANFEQCLKDKDITDLFITKIITYFKN